MENKNFFTTTGGIVTIAVLALCCCLVLVIGAGIAGLSLFWIQATPGVPPTPIEVTVGPNTFEPTITPEELTRVPVDDISTDTLTTLNDTVVPENNPGDLACRLENKCNIPETFPTGPFKVGDKTQFWITNSDTANTFQINASLVYLTEHAYLWIEDGVNYNKNDAKAIVDAFETKMYPTNREFFGSEWTPGVDEDPHVYIVYARGIGATVAGYFSTPDEYHPEAAQYSNAHEMFVFNADNSPLNDSFTYSVLAHEFQHMIHFNQDSNETSWINEGFSELAMLLNGYSVGLTDASYLTNTDVQLNDWDANPGSSNAPHYGSSFLFMAYFLDRFGEKATQELVRNQANSIESVDEVLKSINATDPVTGKPISADDLFIDWAITNHVLDGAVGDGRYVYHNYSQATQARETEQFSTCPVDYRGEVKQYGVDYLHFACNGTVTLRFEGATLVNLLPADAHSGKMAFWSNKGDRSNMTLTREFDFASVSGPLTLKYQTWYDLEENYDYTFVETSTDGGQTWQILTTPSGTADDPSGNSYGWGYNGKSNGWIEESVDLSQFAGQKVQIRFEYVTDTAVNGEGFLVDDISIPEIQYATDFETDDGGWEASGFARVENALPQTFRLALITKGNQTNVQIIEVAPDQTAEITLDFTNGMNDAILVVSGTARFTRIPGSYSVSVR